jgi:hypothetical protein
VGQINLAYVLVLTSIDCDASFGRPRQPYLPCAPRTLEPSIYTSRHPPSNIPSKRLPSFQCNKAGVSRFVLAPHLLGWPPMPISLDTLCHLPPNGWSFFDLDNPKYTSACQIQPCRRHIAEQYKVAGGTVQFHEFKSWYKMWMSSILESVSGRDERSGIRGWWLL